MERGVLRLIDITSQRPRSTLFYVELLLSPDELARYCEGCRYGSWESAAHTNPRYQLCQGCQFLNVAYCSTMCRDSALQFGLS